jgi:hypothetical protein
MLRLWPWQAIQRSDALAARSIAAAASTTRANARCRTFQRIRECGHDRRPSSVHAREQQAGLPVE